MRYIYGTHYVGVNIDPVKHIIEFNKRKKCQAVLIYIISDLSIIDAIDIQLNLKSQSTNTLEEYFQEHGKQVIHV